MMPAEIVPGLGCDTQRQFGVPHSQQMAPMSSNWAPQFNGAGLQQPVSATTINNSASMMGRSPPGPVGSARNPFAAMPRELRNHQLRNNLQAVAEAFSAASVSGAPAPGAAAAATQPPPPPPPAAQGRSGGTRTSWPGSAVPPPPPPSAAAAAAAAGPTYSHHPGCNSTAARAACTAYSAPGSIVSSGMTARHQSLSLPLPVVSCQPGMAVVAVAPGMTTNTYLHAQQQQQQLLVNAPQQQQQQYVGLQSAPVAFMISDPLPYLSMQQAQVQLPHHQQQQQQHMALAPQAGMSQGMPVSGPCNVMMPMEPQCMIYAACSSPGSTAGQQQQQQPVLLSNMSAAVPALAVSAPIAPMNSEGQQQQQLQLQQVAPGQMEQLLMRQQALQALEQAVQQQLLQLLPDV